MMLLLAATFSTHAAESGGRKVYKWVDEHGETHYGDHIPPEYAAQEQHVINSEGVETEHVEAQRSTEQMAIEDQKRRDADLHASRDKNLLNTYGSVSEIERLRDQRLALLSDQVKVTAVFLEILNGRLKKLSGNSMRFSPYSDDPKAPPMTDQVAEDLVRTVNDIRTQQENLSEKQNEVLVLRQQFDSDIGRFKELRGIH